MWFVQWGVEHGPPGTICVDQDMILKGDGHTCMNIVFFFCGFGEFGVTTKKGELCSEKKFIY